MTQRPSEYNYVTNEVERTITFINPPVCISDTRYARWYRDLCERIQFFAIGYGYSQNEYHWIGRYGQEEYNCVIRFLDRFSWVRNEVFT